MVKLINFRKPYAWGFFKRQPELKHLTFYLALFLSCNDRRIEQPCTSRSFYFVRLKKSWNVMDRTPCTVICMRCLFGKKEL
jgi:hypothetical protein